MPLQSDAIIAAINELIATYDGAIEDDLHGEYLHLSTTRQQEAQVRITAAIDRYTIPGSRYRVEMDGVFAGKRQPGWNVPQLLGVLAGIREDYAAGHMQTVQELVHSSLFADFVDMAAELQRKGFKDAAAVLVGSVLEEHLRKLAEKSGIAFMDNADHHRKAEAINTDLGQQVYGGGEQKQVTAWLDFRNNAAHGHYDKYEHSQIALMIAGVRDFLIRHPA